MKILSIRIKNLASLSGEHFIDFESEPLASAGLIAVVGKTGAGKSTILDAMCLALFNKIPRLKDSDGKLVDVDGSELLTNSPLTVLRRGTAHGFAEVCFVAQDQKRYLARWELKRSREKIDGKLQSVQRYLTCLTDGIVIADKTKAVDDNIKTITQLSFEQFTRAVLLAQSEVTAFLKARDNERGELLEYLTNSNIFGKIGQLAYEKTKLIANQRKEIENILGHIELLSEEQVSDHQAQLAAAQQQLTQLETEKHKLNQQQQWFERKLQLEKDIQARQQQLAAQQLQYQQLASEREQLKQLEVFASIRPSVIQQNKVQSELQKLHPQLQTTEQHFATIQQRHELEKVQFQTVDEQFKAQQTFEQTHQQTIDQVRQCIQEREYIGQQFKDAHGKILQLKQEQQPLLDQQNQFKQQLEQLKQQHQQQAHVLIQTEQLKSLDDGLKAHLNPLQRFIQQYQNFEQAYGSVQSATAQLEQNQQQLSSLQQQFGQDEQISAQLSAQRQSRENQLKQSHQLSLVQSQFKQYVQINLEQQHVQARCTELTQLVADLKTQVAQAELKYQSQQQERETLQRVLQQQRLLHAENIEKLREQLIDGEACLVCGSTAHPYKQDHKTLSDELMQLQQQQEQQAIQLEKESFEAWQKVQHSLMQQSSALEQHQQRLKQLAHETLNVQQQLQSFAESGQITLNFAQSSELIEQQLDQSAQSLQDNVDKIEQQLLLLERTQQEQRALIQNIQHIQQQLSSVHQAEQNIQYIIDLLSAEQKQAWSVQTLATASALAQQLSQRAELLQALESLARQITEQQQHLNVLDQKVNFSVEQIAATETLKADLQRKGQENTEQALQLIFNMSHTQVEKPHDWLSEYDAERKNLQLQFNQVRQSYDQVRQQFIEQQRQLDQFKTQLAQLEAQQSTANLEIQHWLAQHSDFNLTVLEQLKQISNEQEQHIRQIVQAAERNLTDAQSAVNTLQQQQLQHLVQQPEIDFEQLQQKLNELVQQLKDAQALRDAHNIKLELHQRNLAKQQQFAERIQQIQTEEHRWGKISGLMGDASGKKFRDYAQQYNLDILIEHANQQLALLSQRYTLKRLEHSLSLAIIDHDMDGETRSVASLSGGESFLTALALSLAIANMASGSMKIESLFIDEGFGTLDASSLHMVMNALDQLQNQGRKVVLISHIQEMHERIPVQIQVKPLGAGASTIEIVG
jgi:exonuclease SbcC